MYVYLCVFVQVILFLIVYLQQTERAAIAPMPSAVSKARPQNKLVAADSPFWALACEVPPVI